MAFGLLHIGEILALDSFVIGVMFCHGRCLLSQVTVYGRLVALTYTSQCLRKRDLHFPLNMPQAGQADAPVHDAVAVRANRCQIAKLLGYRLIVRHVTSRKPRCPASDAVEFTRPTRLLLACPASLKECGKVTAQNQRWAVAIDGWESSLDPGAHGVFVSAEQLGNFLNGVAAVDFDPAMVGATFSHEGHLPPLVALQFRLIAGSLGGRDLVSIICPPILAKYRPRQWGEKLVDELGF